MKYAWLGLLLTGILSAGNQDSDWNVNRRYTVDSVTVAGKGWRSNVAEPSDRYSNGLRRDMLSLVGQKLNPAVLDGISARLKKEFDAREVDHHILRGDVPDHVRIEFEVKQAGTRAVANLSKLVYNSRQGWSGGAMAGLASHQNTVLFGVISDGDTLVERFTGINARWENKHLGSDRLGLKFDFESYHEQWDPNTLHALAAAPNVTSGPYRTRQSFSPTLSIALAKPLTLEVGAAFEQFGSPLANAPAEAANLAVAALRYSLHTSDEDYPQEVFADYNLRAATRAMGSDFVFTSHLAGVHYRITHGRQKLTEAATVGAIAGRAPLSERFVAGNSYFLRGWNKYDIDPLGGNRIAHNTVDYRYGPFETFYDAGAIWDSGQPAIVRHSLGFGIRESVFTLAVAFPIRTGHVEPIFMMGMIY
ncbi:MAG: BamA/TamA family outer membrane protein [Acidobacteriota bacterium]|nr:BamA/TamA family outer membrane protein [Acidobacteriota bacterium]